MAKEYFTSDWHLYHAVSIDFDKRPFRDLDHMHEVLINNYNSTIGENDICYFLGDLGNGRPEDLGKIIKQLNGTKIIILGNHDKPGLDRWLVQGFSAVLYGAQFVIAKNNITASHCPLLDTYREDTTNMKGVSPREPWHGNSRPRHRLHSFPNWGQFHIHGHIHSRKGNNKSVKILHRQFDVGVCANDYRPVSKSTLESWIAKTLQEEF